MPPGPCSIPTSLPRYKVKEPQEVVWHHLSLIPGTQALPNNQGCWRQAEQAHSPKWGWAPPLSGLCPGSRGLEAHECP